MRPNHSFRGVLPRLGDGSELLRRIRLPLGSLLLLFSGDEMGKEEELRKADCLGDCSINTCRFFSPSIHKLSVNDVELNKSLMLTHSTDVFYCLKNCDTI